MLNVTKGDFLHLMISVAQTCNAQWTPAQVRQSAEEIYSNSIPKRKGSTDRFILGGYVVLLEQCVPYEVLADPQQLPHLNFLLSKKGMEFYLRNECNYYGFPMEKTNVELNRIMRSFCRFGW